MTAQHIVPAPVHRPSIGTAVALAAAVGFIGLLLQVAGFAGLGLFASGVVQGVKESSYTLDPDSRAYQVGYETGLEMGADPEVQYVDEDEARKVCTDGATNGTSFTGENSYNAVEGCVVAWLQAQDDYMEGSL